MKLSVAASTHGIDLQSYTRRHHLVILASSSCHLPDPAPPLTAPAPQTNSPPSAGATCPSPANTASNSPPTPTTSTPPYLVEEATTADTTFTLSVVLEANRSYYWRVQARYPDGQSPWSPTAHFTTGRLLYPLEGARITLPDTLRWRPGDDPMQHGFTLQIAADDAFEQPLLETRTHETHFALSEPPLEAGRSYAWRLGTVGVVMHWSPARGFTVAATGPAAPRLTHPDDGAVDLAQPITLRCGTAPGAPPPDGYFFEVADDAAFAHVVFEADDDGSEGRATVAGLAPGRRYYWVSTR